MWVWGGGRQMDVWAAGQGLLRSPQICTLALSSSGLVAEWAAVSPGGRELWGQGRHQPSSQRKIFVGERRGLQVVGRCERVSCRRVCIVYTCEIVKGQIKKKKMLSVSCLALPLYSPSNPVPTAPGPTTAGYVASHKV